MSRSNSPVVKTESTSTNTSVTDDLLISQTNVNIEQSPTPLPSAPPFQSHDQWVQSQRADQPRLPWDWSQSKTQAPYTPAIVGKWWSRSKTQLDAMGPKERQSFSHLARIMETDLGKQLFGEDRCSACRREKQECWVYVEDATSQIKYARDSCARCRAGPRPGGCSKSNRVSKQKPKPHARAIPAGSHRSIAPNVMIPYMLFDGLPHVAGDNEGFNGLSRIDVVDNMTAVRTAVKKGRRALRNRSALSPTPPATPSLSSQVKVMPLGAKLPGLNSAELTLLREKQKRLSLNKTATNNAIPDQAALQNALAATLIFAQYEAGSAIYIDKGGWILTCAHCFGDDEDEYRAANKTRWLLSYSGLAVQAECRVWDPKRDLALLKVVAMESDKSALMPTFPFVEIATNALSNNMSIYCIGQPGRDDLESTSERKTKYNLVEVSKGKFRGIVPGVDPQDNSEIGTLKHDAWTYWGHSGAPLLSAADGTLIGLHSSWDDQTAMRHGIPFVAVKEFLQKEVPEALKRLMSIDLGEDERGFDEA